ncbi:hypothetical protein WB66_11720 [bacteria symbiont BFo1 of Frankliniella occidentalis]|jgi:hypothetical protein|uniref:DUF2848 domain-containing protein n=1 Tax=Erwinia TaxID=551 RepID=UPI000664659D|nr:MULTISPECIES: DUF2848 domain-containing protein [Erwinia]KYP84569.1 hypothetical protein WB66_11720 [bacteria symbiont BFo1 of Frankliniella occidentalis]PIJ58237.1 hypothetical protein BOM23_10845 [Erwinia sp. OLMDLW33]KYP89809.1 hypothetical protein WB91_11510 [bacteria symbiont BFo1 of Frankliniella occidentalis]MDI3442468.1 DUF2848 domain-containing protein [Erwinia sp. V90_4]CAH0271084.1 hypothetical protein SRABI13_03491 [Erwinia aphidicola]
MNLTFNRASETENEINVVVNHLIIAGWTGRDEAAVLHHIHELEALGVPRPGAVPLFYRVTANQLSQHAQLEVVGEATSGEAEPLIFAHQGKLWLSLASDHTDREFEAVSVAMSKQLCIKPVAHTAWPLDSVIARWDSLILRSWIKEQGEWQLYQQGTLAAMRTPQDLMDRYGTAFRDGMAMTCGTLAAIGGIRPAAEFRMELVDEEGGRTIAHQYHTHALPVVA